MDHQREIVLSKRRQRKFDFHAPLLVAYTGVTLAAQRTFDQRFHLGSALRLFIAAPRDFHVQRHMPCGQPGTRIQQLHLNARRLGRGGVRLCLGSTISASNSPARIASITVGAVLQRDDEVLLR